jgi:hypothetical protein
MSNKHFFLTRCNCNHLTKVQHRRVEITSSYCHAGRERAAVEAPHCLIAGTEVVKHMTELRRCLDQGMTTQPELLYAC